MGDVSRIEFQADRIAIVVGEEIQAATMFLPANQLWMPTDIEIKPGQMVKISSRGRAHLALHHLVDAAIRDDPVEYEWTGPSGKQTKKPLPGDKIRNERLICQNGPYGELLGFISYSDQEIPSPVNPRPGKIYRLSNFGYIRNDIEKTGKLWLTLNDLVLDGSDRSRDLFLLNEKEIKKRYDKFLTVDKPPLMADRKRTWNKILKEGRWNMWFDDNIGSYQVNLKFVDKIANIELATICNLVDEETG